MALKKKPVNGMKDILPREARIRDYVTGIIKDTYRSYGFKSIETPVMEDINNLLGSKGGENEKLIFKVLKRGEKLKIKEANEENDVVDFGLRYDLTVPLCRYYANNENELSTPFKALQMGNVWRADRPQKGRYRQFMQCDIDILGEASNLAEIELIKATGDCISNIGFKNFKIRINDRRILKAMARCSGFDDNSLDEVFITLDKMDKIGIEGVREVLIEEGYDKDIVNTYIDLFNGKINDSVESDEEYNVAKNSIDEIINITSASKTGEYDIVFDPTLVRGMGYYTGTIFEVSMPEFSSSCGGGGRYDKLVGSFLGKDVPACGFSIGFERIIMLLMDSGFELPGNKEKIAFLIEKGYPKEGLLDIFKEADKLRGEGIEVLVSGMNKNKKFQKEQLLKEGYTKIQEFFAR